MNTTTNTLKHVFNVNNNTANYEVVLRLDDNCKNGHEDFSLTGTFWQPNKARTDRNMIVAGCCHKEIIKHLPQLKIFVDLHLCDHKGIPMHAISNGFYHLKHKMGGHPAGTPAHAKYFREYYRLTEEQYNQVKDSPTKDYFAYALVKSGTFETWKEQADKGIETLENLIGLKFKPTGTRESIVMPTEEVLTKVEEQVKSGYFAPEAIKEREQQKEKDQIQQAAEKLTAELKKQIEKVTTECEVNLIVLNTLGLKALENCIFYNHSQQLAFNWRGYDNLPTDVVQSYKEALKNKLPEGVTIK